MFLLIFIFYPFLEILAFRFFSNKFGLGNTFLEVIFSGFLGIAIMIIAGKSALNEIRGMTGKTGLPGLKVFSRALLFASGFLFFLPGILTDGLGLLLLTPGLRELIGLLIMYSMKKKVLKGFQPGFSPGQNQGAQFFYWSNQGSSHESPKWTGFENQQSSQNPERDVIEVTPLQVTNSEKQDPQ